MYRHFHKNKWKSFSSDLTNPGGFSPQVSHNTVPINCVGLETTWFPTETVVIKHGAKKLLTLVTYDWWASHCKG